MDARLIYYCDKELKFFRLKQAVQRLILIRLFHEIMKLNMVIAALQFSGHHLQMMTVILMSDML